MAELKVNQVDCANCGSKIDIRTGLRAKTFTCDYCGAVCEDDQVVAIQDQQKLKTQFAPMSFLKLGLKGTFLGQPYQIIGRIRLMGSEDGESWFWDEWFLMSPTGFPLWLIEDEHGYGIMRLHVASEFIDPYSPATTYFIDKKTYRIKERGFAKIAFLEGELTWKARPNEGVNYLDLSSGTKRFSMEYSQTEIQYIKGESITEAALKEAFKESLPPELASKTTKRPPRKKKAAGMGWWVIGGIMLIAGVLALGVSFTTDKFGTSDFDEASTKYIPLQGGYETEYEYAAIGAEHKTFEITSGPVVKFQFSSTSFPYPSYRTNQEVGWWLSATLYKVGQAGDDEKIGVINADFWRAKGYEDGESWTESKLTDTTYVKGLEKGARYYFIFSAGPFVRNGRNYKTSVRLRTKVVSGAWNPKPLRYFSYGAIGFPAILLIIFLALRNND